jgi:polyhydroxyalkanoate synthesis regulator phasin
METPNTPNSSDNVVEVEVITRNNGNSQERETAEELIRKIAEAGLGLFNLAKDRFERTLNELGNRNGINFSREEGKEMVNNFLDEADRARDTFESKAREISEKIISRLDFSHRREVRELQERLEKLESLLAEKAK